MEIFVKRLKETMKEKDISRKQLAVEAQISEVNVMNYLRGEYLPKKSTVPRIAKALGVSEEWLMGEDLFELKNEMPVKCIEVPLIDLNLGE